MNKLYIFDFDHTLINDNGAIHLIKLDGTRKKLTPQEYYEYRPKKGERIDLSAYDHLNKPTLIKENLDLLRKYHENACVLTARSHSGIIIEFLKTLGITVPVHAVGIHDPNKDCVLINAHRKKDWIRNAILSQNLNYVEFWDDNHFNIECANELCKEFPKVKIITHLVK